MRIRPTFDFLPTTDEIYMNVNSLSSWGKRTALLGKTDAEQLITNSMFLNALTYLGPKYFGALCPFVGFRFEEDAPLVAGFFCPTSPTGKPVYEVYEGVSPFRLAKYVLEPGGKFYNDSLYHYKIYCTSWISYAYVAQLYRGLSHIFDFINFCMSIGICDGIFEGLSYSLLSYSGRNLYTDPFEFFYKYAAHIGLSISPSFKFNFNVPNAQFAPITPDLAEWICGGKAFKSGGHNGVWESWGLVMNSPYEAFGNIIPYYPNVSQGYGVMPTMIDYMRDYPNTLTPATIMAGVGGAFEDTWNPFEKWVLSSDGMLKRYVSCPIGLTEEDTGVECIALRPYTCYGIPWDAQIDGGTLKCAGINFIYFNIEPIGGI